MDEIQIVNWNYENWIKIAKNSETEDCKLGFSVYITAINIVKAITDQLTDLSTFSLNDSWTHASSLSVTAKLKLYWGIIGIQWS